MSVRGVDFFQCDGRPHFTRKTFATKAEAEDKMALIETLATDDDALSLLSEAMNFDFASKGIDEPFTDELTELITRLAIGGLLHASAAA